VPYAELLAEDPRKIEVVTDFSDRYQIRSLPGSNYHKDTQTWRVKTSWAACLTLRGLFRDDLVIGENLIKWASAQRLTRINPAMALRDVLSAELLEDDQIQRIIRIIGQDIEAGEAGRRLFAYQRADTAYLVLARHAILANPPGLGKTGSVIRALQVLTRLDELAFPVLVIAPNTVKRTWEDELRKWAPDLRVSVVDGPAGKRRKAIESDADVYVINWEALRIHSRLSAYGAMALTEDEKTPRELNQRQFRTVIADEAHRARDAHAKQTRAMWALMHAAEFRYLLTGTPVVSNMGDLWSLLHAVEPEGFPAKTKYIERWARVELGFFGGAEILGLNPETADEFRAVTEPLYRRIPKAAALPQLPPKLDVMYRYCDMSLPQSRLYQAMEKDMITEVQGGLVSAANGLAKLTRLLQFAAASAETYEDTVADKETGEDKVITRVRLKMPSSKVEDLVDLLDETDEEPLVAVAVSTQLIRLAAARLAKAEISCGVITGDVSTGDRQEYIRQFQAGEIRVMLMNIDAGGEGITLTRASRILFMQRSWSKVKNEQVEDRLHRIGQAAPVQVIDQIAPGTVEYRKLDILADKGERIEEIVGDQAALLKLLGQGKIIHAQKRNDHGKESHIRRSQGDEGTELAARRGPPCLEPGTAGPAERG
jgi:SNF2 family DNA or RNA helicase